jgi:biofilm PGA synthesis N-glycosyltransferase PgaC
MISFFFLVVYAMTMLCMAAGFIKLEKFRLSHAPDLHSASIVMSARNEEKNIVSCITGISDVLLATKDAEILFTHDAGSDQTGELARAILEKKQVTHRYSANTERKGKKVNLQRMIDESNGDLVVVRDADTFHSSPLWLETIRQYYATMRPDMIIAPVTLCKQKGFLAAFQQFENDVLTVVSAGSTALGFPFLCSGANLAFSRSAFQAAGGYKSHLHIESGDDVLLLHEMKRKKMKIGFLNSPDAVVHTYPMQTWKDVVAQKTRWASKFRFSSSLPNLLMSLLTFFVNGFFLAHLFLIVSGSMQSPAFILLKCAIDLFLLILSFRLFKKNISALHALLSVFLYPFYAVFIGITSTFSKPEWQKSRITNKI